MKKLYFLAISIAILAAFFASTLPDGLDFVALKLGFAEKGIERWSPLSGFPAPISGIVGVLFLLAIFYSAVYLLKKRNKA